MVSLLRNITDNKIGRGTRPSPETGKTDCLVIDLVGNCDRFPLGVDPSLDVRAHR